ncbi:MAG: polysaccharide pyruvyl transferase family protein [Clostridiales bacterium]|nr:polysaccharide pyruvyl transferase family protein [Clostridiales bacterium]
MKIALLTIWHEKNYGAELQAYATIKLLQGLGHEVRMIDIRLSDKNVKNLKAKVAEAIENCGPASRKFKRFWKKHIPTTQRYRSILELQERPPQADIYVVGSDQVWNPGITGKFSDLYFLNFGDENIKRISIASSFGQDTWDYPSEVKNKSQLLSRFSHITCREASGIDILKKTFSKNSDLVLDPTLILATYSDLIDIKSISERNTLVYYPLSYDEELSELANTLAKETGMQVINNNAKTTILNRLTWNRVGIEEWLKNMAEAKFVITRSFHGLAFSLIFNKNFAVLKTRNNKLTRITNLLSLVGLEHRVYDSVTDLKVDEPWNKPLDYDTINPKLNKLRDNSIKIIQSMM